MKRFRLSLVLLLAALGIGAVGVSSLPGFNRSTDDGKAIAITSRGLAWRHGVNGTIDVRDYGADATGVSDSLSAFTNAMNAAASGVSGTTGYTLHIPRGTYLLSDTWHLNKHIRVVGDGPKSSVLRFAAARSGIVVHSYNSAPNGVGNGAGAEISGIGLEPTANATAWQAAHAYVVGDRVRSTTNLKDGLIFRCTTAGTSHASVEPTMPAYGATVVDNGVTWTADYSAGLWLRASATVRNVQIGGVTGALGFAGHGFQIIANTGDTPSTNANSWSAERVSVFYSRGDGVRAQGTDANAGSFANGTVSSNGGWGVKDASFIGNAWVNVTSQDNDTGGYNAPNTSSIASFTNCYSEGDEPASEIIYPNSALGSFVGSFTAASTGSRFVNGRLSGYIFSNHGNATDGYTQTTFSTTDTEPDILSTYKVYDTAGVELTGNTALNWKWWRGAGLWRIDLSNSDFYVTANIGTDQQSYIPSASWIFPHGITLGEETGNYNTVGVYLRSATAAPATCRHIGDLYYNNGSTGPIGWRCVSTSPVIWKTIVGGKSQTIAATGSTQGDAAAITSAHDTWNVTGGNTFVGVVLPTGPTGDCKRLFNNGGTLKVYPGSSDTIEGGAANASVNQTANIGVTYCLESDATNWIRN